jgi:hypothetical protein
VTDHADCEFTIRVRFHIEGPIFKPFEGGDEGGSRELADQARAMIDDELGFLAHEPGCSYDVEVIDARVVTG